MVRRSAKFRSRIGQFGFPASQSREDTRIATKTFPPRLPQPKLPVHDALINAINDAKMPALCSLPDGRILELYFLVPSLVFPPSTILFSVALLSDSLFILVHFTTPHWHWMSAPRARSRPKARRRKSRTSRRKEFTVLTRITFSFMPHRLPWLDESPSSACGVVVGFKPKTPKRKELRWSWPQCRNDLCC